MTGGTLSGIQRNIARLSGWNADAQDERISRRNPQVALRHRIEMPNRVVGSPVIRILIAGAMNTWLC